ncbi:MAG: radical SAM protein [Spirochaetes bacterium]|nr:radical SAM protein [Spirochaetota bacterium]
MRQYISLYESGELERRVHKVEQIMHACTLCPHVCGVNRIEGEKGKCKTGMMPIVASFHPHFGEESCLVGRGGSGTIFFSNCNLACVFCQNYDISQLGFGEEVSFDELAGMMLVLQRKGCHNINFVTPTHMVYAILRALLIAIPQGLTLPLVYNSGGYDSVDTLHLLDGIFDIYMPDFKYFDETVAMKYSSASNYPLYATRAVEEMHRQVGDLVIDNNGIAQRGLLIRHLVLPNDLAGTKGVMRILSRISRHTYINIMDQYRPQYRAHEYPDLKRRVTLQEFDEATEAARAEGLYRFDPRIRW